MLLFNKIPFSSCRLNYNFNTSNVTIQLTIILPKKSHALYFNTSNVTIQLSRMFFFSAFLRISIHLMLLFNLIYLSYFASMSNFNTSNVTIQPPLAFPAIPKKPHFNTSNVTIQHVVNMSTDSLSLFQYI